MEPTAYPWFSAKPGKMTILCFLANCVGFISRKTAIFFFLSFIFNLLLFSADKNASPNIAAILQKNVFFSPLEKQEKPGPPVFVTQINQPQSLDKVYVLIGTFVFHNEPEKTTAVLKEIRTNKMLFLKKGDVVSGNRIISIQDNGVIFESGFGERFTLSQSGIKFNQMQVQSFYFRVNLNNVFESISMDPKILSTINISSADGAGGFRVKDIEPGSVFESCGLAVNDVIYQIDDTILKTPDDAISAYKKTLMTGKKFVIIKILRNKKPINLVYICE